MPVDVIELPAAGAVKALALPPVAYRIMLESRDGRMDELVLTVE